jgi:hypothetical protein
VPSPTTRPPAPRVTREPTPDTSIPPLPPAPSYSASAVSIAPPVTVSVPVPPVAAPIATKPDTLADPPFDSANVPLPPELLPSRTSAAVNELPAPALNVPVPVKPVTLAPMPSKPSTVMALPFDTSVPSTSSPNMLVSVLSEIRLAPDLSVNTPPARMISPVPAWVHVPASVALEATSKPVAVVFPVKV